MNISKVIRDDRAFTAFAECLAFDLKCASPLPIVINGLSGGAAHAFITETVREAIMLGRVPTVILTPDDTERSEVFAMLSRAGLRVAEYKPRELVFHNISATHD